MKSNKNWKLPLISFVAALIVLFGGNFIYQDVRLEKPIEQAIASIEGITLNNIQLDNKKAELTIEIQDVENFVDTFHQIEDELKPLIGERDLQLHFESEEDQTLLHAWNNAYFDIAQAIAKEEYSIIPNVIEKVKAQSSLKKAGYGLDEKNVYIDLHNQKNSLYLIIPRDNQEVNNHG